jgi:hypothetical protein
MVSRVFVCFVEGWASIEVAAKLIGGNFLSCDINVRENPWYFPSRGY